MKTAAALSLMGAPQKKNVLFIAEIQRGPGAGISDIEARANAEAIRAWAAYSNLVRNVRAGAVLNILETRGEWLRVATIDKREAWVAADDVAELTGQ